nr:GTP cyclohydrolase I [Deltaproteobacteria bacterium]
MRAVRRERATGVLLDFTSDTLLCSTHYLRSVGTSQPEIRGLVAPAAARTSARWCGGSIPPDGTPCRTTTRRGASGSETCFLFFNPVAFALEAIDGHEAVEGGAGFGVSNEERGHLVLALEVLGTLPEDQYYLLSTRFDVLERGRSADGRGGQGVSGQVRLSAQAYRALDPPANGATDLTPRRASPHPAEQSAEGWVAAEGSRIRDSICGRIVGGRRVEGGVVSWLTASSGDLPSRSWRSRPPRGRGGAGRGGGGDGRGGRRGRRVAQRIHGAGGVGASGFDVAHDDFGPFSALGRHATTREPSRNHQAPRRSERVAPGGEEVAAAGRLRASTVSTRPTHVDTSDEAAQALRAFRGRWGSRSTPTRGLGYARAGFARLARGVSRRLPAHPAAVLAEALPSTERCMVVLAHVSYASMCPHHLLPSAGRATLGYLPGGRIVGLGALVQLLECFAHRLVLQETLGRQVAEALMGSTSGARRRVVLEGGTRACRFGASGRPRGRW